jgi:hypothetical protein
MLFVKKAEIKYVVYASFFSTSKQARADARFMQTQIKCMYNKCVLPDPPFAVARWVGDCNW